MFKLSHDIVTIGGATRDIMFYTDEGRLVGNQADPLRQKLIGFEYGAKIKPVALYQVLGGGGCNTAVCFARLGLKTATFIRLGLDRDGDAIRADLVSEKVIPRFIERDKNYRTGMSFIVIQPKSGEHVAFLNRGANDQMLITQSELRRARTKWFYVCSLTGKYWQKSVQNICRYLEYHKKIKLAWNPGSTQIQKGHAGLARLLRRTAVFILNQDEATELVASAKHKGVRKDVWQLARIIKGWGPDIVDITRGDKGACVYDGKNRFFEKAISVRDVDTTGAGDAFGSTFVAGIIKYKKNLKRALRMAAVNSASVVGAVGAQTDLLYLKELTQRAKQYYKKDW